MIRSDAVNIRPHSIPAIGWRPNRDDIDWPIERVIFGTGEPDADGWVLDRGQFYASDVVVCDLGTFHPIDRGSLCLHEKWGPDEQLIFQLDPTVWK